MIGARGSVAIGADRRDHSSYHLRSVSLAARELEPIVGYDI